MFCYSKEQRSLEEGGWNDILHSVCILPEKGAPLAHGLLYPNTSTLSQRPGHGSAWLDASFPAQRGRKITSPRWQGEPQKQYSGAGGAGGLTGVGGEAQHPWKRTLRCHGTSCRSGPPKPPLKMPAPLSSPTHLSLDAAHFPHQEPGIRHLPSEPPEAPGSFGLLWPPIQALSKARCFPWGPRRHPVLGVHRILRSPSPPHHLHAPAHQSGLTEGSAPTLGGPE